jgi:Tol biopolymer transport system component
MRRQTEHRPSAAIALVAALLAATAVLALAACGGSSTTASTSASAAPGQAASPSVAASPSETPLPAPTVTGTIAFVKAVEVVDNGNGPFVQDGDIYTVKSDGTGLKRLTDDNLIEGAPSWSPDGRRIVYVVDSTSEGTGVTPHLWIMNADGSGKRQLTKGSVYANEPAWSPDGKRILCVGWGIGPEAALSGGQFYVISAEGGTPKRVMREGAGVTGGNIPVWAPDGRILFANVGDVWSVKPDGSGLTQLTQIGNVTDFALSPDGKSLSVDNNSSGTVEILPVRGGAAVTLLDPISGLMPGDTVNLAWTPDGKALAVADAGSSGSRLCVINADGSGLSAVPGIEDACAPAWRPK